MSALIARGCFAQFLFVSLGVFHLGSVAFRRVKGLIIKIIQMANTPGSTESIRSVSAEDEVY